MSLNCYLNLLRENVSKYNWTSTSICQSHDNKSFKYFCQHCSVNICKLCKKESHWKHWIIKYKKCMNEIDIKSLYDHSIVTKERLIQANQWIKEDFRNMIINKYPQLERYLALIENGFWTNWHGNSEWIDFLAVILSTYNYWVKHDTICYEIFANIAVNIKLNSKLLDATEETYEKRIQSWLEYYKNVFIWDAPETSLNYKDTIVFHSQDKEILSSAYLGHNEIAILFSDNLIEIINYETKTCVKHCSIPVPPGKPIEFSVIFYNSDNSTIIVADQSKHIVIFQAPQFNVLNQISISNTDISSWLCNEEIEDLFRENRNIRIGENWILKLKNGNFIISNKTELGWYFKSTSGLTKIKELRITEWNINGINSMIEMQNGVLCCGDELYNLNFEDKIEVQSRFTSDSDKIYWLHVWNSNRMLTCSTGSTVHIMDIESKICWYAFKMKDNEHVKSISWTAHGGFIWNSNSSLCWYDNSFLSELK